MALLRRRHYGSIFFAGADGDGPMMAQVRDRRRLRNPGTESHPSTTGMLERLMYESSNGDVWVLACDPASKLPAVKHQAAGERPAARGADQQGS
jgi:hypothetical protein